MSDYEQDLEQENARLRAEVQRLTRERDNEVEARCKESELKRMALAERERAEAERNENWDAYSRKADECNDALARAKAAEADCAAVQQICHDLLAMVTDTTVEASLRDVVSGRFSGAALLDRLRAAEANADNFRQMHEANVAAGERVSAAFDAANVGNKADGVFTRAMTLLERLRAAEAVAEAARPVADEIRAVFAVHHASSASTLFLRLNVGIGEVIDSSLAAYDAVKP